MDGEKKKEIKPLFVIIIICVILFTFGILLFSYVKESSNYCIDSDGEDIDNKGNVTAYNSALLKEERNIFLQDICVKDVNSSLDPKQIIEYICISGPVISINNESRESTEKKFVATLGPTYCDYGCEDGECI